MIKYFESELCFKWNIISEQLNLFSSVIPVAGKEINSLHGQLEPYYQGDKTDFQRWEWYAKILSKGTSIQQLQELIEKDKYMPPEKSLIALYAALADECIDNITPHILRTYCIVIFYQQKHNKALFSKELSKVANITEETAFRHLVFLQRGVGLLKFNTAPISWSFEFIPEVL